MSSDTTATMQINLKIDQLSQQLAQTLGQMGGDINELVLHQIGQVFKIAGADFQKIQTGLDQAYAMFDGDPDKPGPQLLLHMQSEIKRLQDQQLAGAAADQALKKALQKSIRGFNTGLDNERDKRQQQIQKLQGRLDTLQTEVRQANKQRKHTDVQQAKRFEEVGQDLDALSAEQERLGAELKKLIDTVQVLSDSRLDITTFNGFLDDAIAGLEDGYTRFKHNLWAQKLVMPASLTKQAPPASPPAAAGDQPEPNVVTPAVPEISTTGASPVPGGAL